MSTMQEERERDRDREDSGANCNIIHTKYWQGVFRQKSASKGKFVSSFAQKPNAYLMSYLLSVPTLQNV